MIVFNEFQVYPIASNRLAFGTFLTVPAGFVVLADLGNSLVRQGRWCQVGAKAVAAVLCVVAGIAAVVLARGSSAQWTLNSHRVPLRLTGSDLVPVPSSQEVALETTVHDVRSRTCTSLITPTQKCSA